MKRHCFFLLLLLVVESRSISAQRVPVLNQIDLPHNYYFRELYIPQLTSGPSAVAWSPDGKSLAYSMGGTLWKQAIGSEVAEQLTDGEGYDYQPDWSPDGQRIIFTRYNGRAIELTLLEVSSGNTTPLTQNKAANLEPRWSPDGHSIVFVSTENSGHFLLYKAAIENNALHQITCLTPDRKSQVKRYYYSAFDHAINPVWSRDGREIYFISNREIIHGTGDIVKMNPDSIGVIKTIHHEETSWKTCPDISPDGSRMLYSSYLGGNWHQLWLLPTRGGSPIPLTYGEYDNTSPRWSPDGEKIAFISNREGNTSLWTVNAYDGGQQSVVARKLKFLKPHVSIRIVVQDETGKPLSARISVIDSKGKFYAPMDKWIQADDSYYPTQQQFESHYFHSTGPFQLMVPEDSLMIQASHGPEYEIGKVKIDSRKSGSETIVVTLNKISLPAGFEIGRSGDLHMHMNYGGHYLTTPERLVEQAECEDLNFAYNLIVNKEQRIPDIKYFSPMADDASTDHVLLLHAQEFHTSFWGHLGLLNLNDHVILPDYVGYPQTAVASLFPNNKFIADRAHEQKALVGYVHPFEQSEIFPELSPKLTNELPVDAALGVVDYYELMGFSDHKASESVWYKLLNCGLHIPAGAGTDAMTNYASLRGPVGLNRVYVKQNGELDQNKFLKALKEGRSFVTNGPIIGLTLENVTAGDTIMLHSKNQSLSYSAFLRSAIPVDHFEIIMNGEVIALHALTGTKKSADVTGRIKMKGSGWVLLRAWSEKADPDLLDIYPYASTNPIYIQSENIKVQSKSAGVYFLKWLDQVEAAVTDFGSYRNEEEKNIILNDIKNAKTFYDRCVREATIK